jgi:hypothetical protein
LRVALARFGERTAQLERQKSEIEWIINELRRASQTVANMLEGRSSEAKPRVRMRAARRTADDEDARRR